MEEQEEEEKEMNERDATELGRSAPVLVTRGHGLGNFGAGIPWLTECGID